MATTYRNLWPQFIAWENLVAAYRRCQRRKRSKPEAAGFDFAWESELLRLQRELDAGSYRPGEYRHFYIHEPKRRKISAAPFRDRVVHHAVVRVLEPIFERRFIHDSYACRRRKGTHRAIMRAQHYLRRHAFTLKTDVVRFFPNVDHAVLLDVLRRTVADRKLLDLLGVVIASGEGVLSAEASPALFPGDDLFALTRPTGMPIGNLTSQFFANVLLDPIDHFIKEDLRARGYVRYADDLVLFGDEKRQLWGWREALNQRLADVRLRLHRDKTQVRPAEAGLGFLGFVLTRNDRRLNQTALLRFNRRLRRMRRLWKQRSIKPSEIRKSVAATMAHARYGNARGVLRSMWPRVRFCRNGR